MMRAWQTAVITGALAVGALACATACAPEAGTPAPIAPLVPAVTATATATVGHATATATASLPPVYVHCTEEDGSAPGQIFPCVWDGTIDGNGHGATYVLTGPAN